MSTSRANFGPLDPPAGSGMVAGMLACRLPVSSPVSFNALVVSLATTAAVHFGDVADRESGVKPPPNLDAAGRAIELLALLKDKTRGNLTADEERFIRQVLHELQQRYRDARQGAES